MRWITSLILAFLLAAAPARAETTWLDAPGSYELTGAQLFKLRAELPPELYRPEYRLTVDEPEDVMLMSRIFDRLYEPGRVLHTIQAIQLLDSEPALASINARVRASGVNVRSVALDRDERRARDNDGTPRERSEPGANAPPTAGSRGWGPREH